MLSYQKELIQKIEHQYEAWHNEAAFISRRELIDFLSSVRVTGKMVGLEGISQCARDLLSHLRDGQKEQFLNKDVFQFLAPLEACALLQNRIEEVDPRHLDRSGEEPLVVIVDEDVTLLSYLKSEMEKQGWMVIATVNPHKALHAFYKMEPDCLIADFQMTNETDQEVFRLLRRKINEKYIPAIVMSTIDTNEVRTLAYANGADDFIAKPFHIEEFLIRVEQKLIRREQIKRMLLIDELTGVYNRDYLYEVFAICINDFERNGSPFSMVILDLDHFKAVNDTYGHLVGDKVLKSFTNILEHNSRHSDVLMRYGGEEFVLILPSTTAEQAQGIVHRLSKLFSEQTFEVEKERFQVTFSAGIVEINDRAKPLTYWFSLADAALYDGKKNGRNIITIGNDEMIKDLNKLELCMTIVEDDDLISSILKSHIKKQVKEDWFDIKVEEYRNAGDFLAVAHERHEKQFLILDAELAENEGLQVLQELKEADKLDDYTVVMLIDEENEESIAKSLRLGADDYITKPFSIHDFHVRLQNYIHRLK